jgi:hypothetical protein
MAKLGLDADNLKKEKTQQQLPPPHKKEKTQTNTQNEIKTNIDTVLYIKKLYQQ